ncbi:MAG: hypothetical protein UW95_C0031G0003 [Parcubacteria group bacterium GW2011_GWC1_45_14]|nr:MAG: hypothetical protein UW87_C0031G0010 [Candidatus Moranbacteria bacterium GW2011_GWC2_45_10]KKT92618.1 MAG: hypothetical protein UW95_C0031G0003 [Parcubacteria group bacterium GW2011_GWC1_45_14]
MEILLSLLFAFLGVIIALIIDREKYPKIVITAGEEANSDNTYAVGLHAGERWKFFRVSVKNKKMPTWINWLLVRQTAENCHANIYIKGINNDIDISYKGRWASTPELAHLDGNSAFLKLLYPDPVTIVEGEQEYLDILTKFEKDKEAYGWNNESYVTNWKNPKYKLFPGKYSLRVVINTQNGVSASKKFMINLEDRIENSKLT